MPVDLEWPRRANVGAIAVIGATRLASFAEVAGALYCGAPGTILQFNAPAKLVSRSNFFGLAVKSQTIALSSITVKHRAITRQFDLRSCDNTNALASKQARREVRSG
ncbi:hypothetical protein N2603_31755 [Bradyrhizobium huanghuaihaiense]|uniref:hypothetical protein n=1 Tax=Bradyrhizobium huanghuaihaiense TaxID=990078 RepID=UPI0021A9972B|nr:hypothetical protein [Bradyrhizobium sp. CB3035]UWU74605.1 hypothetical protein N2603_31755 [Bradyrhizobium sp. CB3035]